MRRKADWIDVTFQFVSFAAMCLILSMGHWPFLTNIILAFGVSWLLSHWYGKVRRRIHEHQHRKASEPKRIRVISIENVED